jgi:CRP-like cAMP-binding protein
VTVAQLGQNEFVGDIGILCDVPRTATVRAVTQLTALKITKELFFRMVTDFPAMGVEVMRVLAHRLSYDGEFRSKVSNQLRLIIQQQEIMSRSTASSAAESAARRAHLCLRSHRRRARPVVELASQWLPYALREHQDRRIFVSNESRRPPDRTPPDEDLSWAR